MSDVASILPPQSTPLERAIEQVAARSVSIQAPIESLVDPQTVPAAFLPFLAQGLSVDVWLRSWGESEQRRAVARSLQLHKLKGSPAALREMIGFAGGEVLRFERPPSTAYVGADFTASDRAAWLKHYPELRIYPFRGKATRPRTFFAGRSYAGVTEGPHAAALVPSTAENRAGRRAFLNDRGTETELSVTVVTAVEDDRIAVREEVIQLQVFKPFALAAGVARRRRFAGGGVRASTITLQQSVAYGAIRGDRRRLTVSPGLTPIDPTPVEGAGTGTVSRFKFFAGASHAGAGRHIMPSAAFLRIYDTVWLYVPGRHVPPRRGRFFSSVTRLGQPAYTADVKVRISKPARARKLYAGGFAGAGHAYPGEQVALAEILEATAAAKSLRDQIYLNINCTQVVRAGFSRLCGDVTCGAQVETR